MDSQYDCKTAAAGLGKYPGYSDYVDRSASSQLSDVRPPACLEGILEQLCVLNERAAKAGHVIHDLADRLLGAVPQGTEAGKNGIGPEGMLAIIQARLDTLESALSHIEYGHSRLVNI